MIKNILWDFDGVILDSMKVKGDGFVELFKDYDKNKVKQLTLYHYKNGGISRFAKIKYFYEKILLIDIKDSEIESLAKDFSKIIEKRLFNKESLIEETLVYIKNSYDKFNFHIVSGSEHNELIRLCKYFKLTNYFITINGSPTYKPTLVKNILHKYNYKKNETMLIGDSINDYKAAKSNNIMFYGFNNELLRGLDNYIDSYDTLKVR